MDVHDIVGSTTRLNSGHRSLFSLYMLPPKSDNEEETQIAYHSYADDNPDLP